MAFVPIRTIVGTDEEDTGFKPLRDVYIEPAPQRGAIAAGLSAGVDQLQGLGYSALGGVADIVGASGARDWANEQARRNQIDASVGGRPDLERIEDQTLGSALPYVGYQIAKQVPTMAGIAGAQLIPGAGQVAGAVGLTRLGAVAPRMLGGGGLQAGSSIAARRAALAQGEAFGTGTLAGSAMGFGSLYGESVEGGDPSPFKSLALAPIYGAAEAVLPAVLQGSLRAPARYSGNLGTRMAKAGGVAGAGETLTELGQNELEMGMRSDLTDEEIASRRLNAAAAGLIVGGSLGTAGGLRGPLRPDTESDLTKPLDTTTRPDPSQFVTQDQTVGLKKFIDENTGVVRPSRKDYEKQFEAAFSEPSGQFVADAATGVERELTVGELMQRGSASMDLTQDKPADAAAAATAATKVATTRDPRDVFLRDELKVVPNNNSRQLFTMMEEQGIDPTSPAMVPVWNYAAAKYMTPSRLTKATELMDKAIIESRKEAPSGTGVSTVQQPAGSVGVGSPVVQGTVGNAGRVAPVAGAVDGGAPAAGAPLQQAGILSVAPGQPSTPVTTTAPAVALGQPSTTGATSGTQASQTIQTAPQGQTATTVPAAAPIRANTTLRLNKQEAIEDPDAALANYVEIARDTGNTAGIDATLADAAGKRQDQRDFTKENIDEIIEAQLGKGKNQERDRKILRAYVLARRAAPYGNKGKISDQVGAAFGIKGSRVRQIGNPEKLADLAVSMGFDRNQVFTELGIESTKEAAVDLSKTNEPTGQDGDTEVPVGDAAETVGDTAEGDVEVLADDSRFWQESSTAGSQAAVDLVTLADKIADLREVAAEMEQIGVPEVVAATTARIEELTAQYQAIVSSYEAKPESEATAPKKQKRKAKTEVAQVAAEEKDAAKEAEAAKFRAERAAKLQADRNGLAVGDTVKNPKLGTGVVKSFAGDGDATTVTVAFQSGQTKELSVKLAKLEKTNAVQVESPAGVPVQPKAEAGKEVGRQVRRAPKPAAEGKAQVPAVILTQAEQAAQAWDVVAADFPEAPKFADLTKAQQNTFIGFGEGNWERGDVELELIKLARGGMKFGKEGDIKPAIAKNPYTAKELLAELKDFIRADIPGRKLLVVDSIEDLLRSPDKMVRAVGAGIALEGAYGVAVNGRAYLIANRIQKGAGRAKFMHEVGAHLGLEKLLPKAQYDKLTQQILTWARKDDGSIESELALNAVERVQAAGTKQEDRRSEMLAYFIEEAMEAGIDPTAGSKNSAALTSWFRTLWAAFKVAVRRLGMKPESMNAQDVVNLAFGAARLEINGTWHGTAADFRKFSNEFMGTGEGAQAYGWGTYLAQRTGIAKGYWSADVARKSGGSSKTTGPEGTLMRVDTAVTPEETLDWDRPLSEQPAILKKLGMLMPQGLQEALADQYQQNVEDIGDLTGEDLYRGLRFLEKNEGAVSEFWGIDDYVGQPGKKVASLFLDSMGIKGIQFLDAKSRGGKREVTHDGTRYDASLKFNTLRDIAFEGLATVKRETKQRVDDFVELMFNNAKESSARFELKFDEAAERKGAEKRGAATPWGERLAWIEANESNISIGEAAKTRNLVIFDDKNIFRVGSEVAADRQRMKFGSDMVELGKRGQLKGKAGTTRVDTANNRAIKLLDKADKTKDPAEAAALRAEANALFSATAGKLTGMKFGKNAPTNRQGLIDRNIAKLPKMSQQPVKRVTEALGDLGGKYLDYAVFTSDLVKRAVAAGLPAAQTFSDRLASRNAKVSEEERKIEKIADRYASIEEDAKGSGPGSVNEFLFESTRTGKWGYDTAKFKADPAMKAMFDKLKPKAQQFVKDVFAHGDATLSNKKKIVLEATNSEYDAMIKAAQDVVNTATDSKSKADAEERLAKLKSEKAATLKRFQTLFRIREGMPYAPIKRTGTYAVVAESDAFQAAKEKEDTETIQKLESDPNHYSVSFVDTKWTGRNLKDSLAEEYPNLNVNIVKRAEAMDDFSKNALMPALTKMRSAVTLQNTREDGKIDPTAGKLLNIINQLYLEALAEGSARKSEMRRRGVAGEVDMLQSFTQQGRADANFLASVEFEPKIQDALQQMRNQSRKGDRERKSEIFDELTQRYAGTLDPQPSPFISGLTNMASKFFLASSPAYYLQNLTQPFMMSLPAMAGRHDYTKAAAEMAKAYTELGPLFKDVKLFDQQFDFSKVPADVRTAINELVNQGKIDIGLATEINEYKVEADGKLSAFAQRLNKGMRMAVQKTEAVNRLSTAIAAYRLEYAKTKDAAKATQYAADILTDTHGDYTAFNAPRAFNTQWGKVALQFRKFQLIQIAFYTKLIRDAFTKPDERAAALKTLGYSLGHTAVFAGMMGLPGYAAISAILSAFGDEDEPYDLTAEMRKALGPEWADMIMRGAPTVVGMDLSGKIGAGNMLSIMPFSDADLSTNAGRAEAFGTLMGGAALGMSSRIIDGLGLILDGDYYKGVERVMPKGVSDALKAGRQAAEGMTRRNGDVVLPDSEIGAIDTVLTGLGVPAVKQAVTYERQNRMRDITENFNDRTKRIKNDYAKAVREKDTQGMAEARAAWTKLQQTRQRNGLQSQPVSALLKAPQEQKAREQRTVGGVQYREGQRKLAESIAEN